jgi:hypothetical protein
MLLLRTRTCLGARGWPLNAPGSRGGVPAWPLRPQLGRPARSQIGARAAEAHALARSARRHEQGQVSSGHDLGRSSPLHGNSAAWAQRSSASPLNRPAASPAFHSAGEASGPPATNGGSAARLSRRAHSQAALRRRVRVDVPAAPARQPHRVSRLRERGSDGRSSWHGDPSDASARVRREQLTAQRHHNHQCQAAEYMVRPQHLEALSNQPLRGSLVVHLG